MAAFEGRKLWNFNEQDTDVEEYESEEEEVPAQTTSNDMLLLVEI